jgi:hypothetical protein
MQLKNLVSLSTLGGFIATLAIGCSDASDVPLAKAPAPTPAPPQELPKEVKKGGGPSSSGNMKRNPGADPLAPQ